MSQGSNFDDFTEFGYRRLLRTASYHYKWAFYDSPCETPHIILRHDCDHSPQRARALALIEAEESVRSTFLVLLHSPFYNFLEHDVVTAFREIAAMGHRIGLHFDMSFYGDITDFAELERRAAAERRIIENTVEEPCLAFSFHNPTTNSSLSFRQDDVAGMCNAYGATITRSYQYVSDSNGYWRHDDAFRLVEAAEHPRIHMLIHPEWWTPEAMSPRQRILRAAQGRRDAAMGGYDELLTRWDRLNVH